MPHTHRRFLAPRLAILAITALACAVPAFAQKKPAGAPRWMSMDLGPTFTSTMGPDQGAKFDGVAKALCIRIGDDEHVGGVMFDTDTLRMVAGWTGGFVNILPGRNALLDNDRILGEAQWATPKVPGWSKDGSFDDPRKAPFGPIPRDWAKWKGHYIHGDRVVLSYSVADTDILETPAMTQVGGAPLFVRYLWVGASDKPIEVLITGSGTKLDKPSTAPLPTDVGVVSATAGGSGRVVMLKADGRVVSAVINPSKTATPVTICIWSRKDGRLGDLAALPQPPKASDIAAMIKGGPARYPQPAVTQAEKGKGDGPYVVDTVTAPYDNPWNSILHFGDHDFFSDGRAAICTMEGDVFVVSSANGTSGGGPVHKAFEGDSNQLQWRRYATGMYHPLGLKIVNDTVYVTCRDQLTRLHDLNNDGEADFYESFNNDINVGFNSHEFTTTLNTDPEGNFIFIKGTNGGQTVHDSSIIMVSKDGKTLTPYATGFRWPNGMGMSKAGVITAADQQGNWVPASRLDIIEKGGFYGFMSSHHRDTPPKTYDGPMCWIPHGVDNSCGGQTFVESDRWGPLQGRMLHLSYGKCLLFLALHENITGVPGKPAQGGVILFPCEKFLSGSMRARFNAVDGQLYVSGLQGWQTSGAKDGCLQRVRYTGKPVYLPDSVHVAKNGVTLTFTDALDKESAGNPDNWAVERWQYRWTQGYGSKEYSVENAQKVGHDAMDIAAIKVGADGKSVFIELPDIAPVMQQAIRWNIKAADGHEVKGDFYHTIHKLGD